MSQEAFRAKWSAIRAGGREMNLEEKSIYVEKGDVPRTQRQLALYWCFRFVRAHLARIGARKVIEVGCGRGTIGLYCRDYLGLEVTLLDKEEDAIRIAEEAFAAHGLDATLVVGDALHMDLPDDAFDAAVSIGLAEHVDAVEELFAEQLRVLRPGGLMISLNIPKKFSVQHMNYAMRMMKKSLGLYAGHVFNDYYRNAYTAEDYARFARNVGFASAQITHVCPFAFFAPIRRSTDRAIATAQRGILRLRSFVRPYPYQANRVLAKEHFLVAQKLG